MLGELGGSVIDADDLARRATRSGAPALAPIRARFGAEVFDAQGDLDRAALAGVVFEDEAALRDLEAIVHPEVRTLVNLELERAAAADAPFTVVEAIKLVEGGLAERCDQVWIIDCGPATQRVRLAERGADATDIERRLTAQGLHLADSLAARMGQPARLRRISTESGLDETRALVEDALAEFLAEALDIG
jgi:dephospho-CoA kinase